MHRSGHWKSWMLFVVVFLLTTSANAAADPAPPATNSTPIPTVDAWAPVLEAAFERSQKKPAIVPAAEEPEQARVREADVSIASFFLRDTPEATAKQVEKALRTLIAHEALNETDREGFARALIRLRKQETPELKRLMVEQGASMIAPIAVATTDANKADAAVLLKQLHIADLNVPKHLLRLGGDPNAFIHTRQRALELVDLVTHGADSLPLPPEAFETWMSILMQDERRLAEPVVNALVRRPESGWKEEDRDELLLLSKLQFRSTWQFEEITKKIPHVKSPRVAPLLAKSLGRHLSSNSSKVRDFCAHALSLWPEGAAMASAELGHYISTAPAELTADGFQPSDPRRLDDAARVLVANGARSKAAALTIAPALLDRDRRDRAERVLAAIGSDAATPLSANYLWQVARNGDPVDRGPLVAALTQVTSVSPAAEDLLLFILLSGEPSRDLRIVATWGLRNANARRPEVRQVLLKQCSSSDADLVQHASSALMRVGMGETLPLDLPLTWLRGTDATMRIKAAKLLATAGPRAADQGVPLLLRMADNVDPKQRLVAARALVAIDPDGKRLSPALLFSVYHADEAMRHVLLPSIRKAADAKTQSRLKDLSENEPDAVVRLAARQTLEKLTSSN